MPLWAAGGYQPPAWAPRCGHSNLVSTTIDSLQSDATLSFQARSLPSNVFGLTVGKD
jgi:hypothetical protein